MKMQWKCDAARRAEIRPRLLLGVVGVVAALLLGLYLLRPSENTTSGENQSEEKALSSRRSSRAVLGADDTSSGSKVPTPMASLKDEFGIEVKTVRLAMAGRAVDVRYTIVDPERAAGLDKRANITYLLDEKTGERVGMPQSPPPLELHRPTEGSDYFVIFKNTQAVKAGSKVTLVVGNAQATHLTVE